MEKINVWQQWHKGWYRMILSFEGTVRLFKNVYSILQGNLYRVSQEKKKEICKDR